MSKKKEDEKIKKIREYIMKSGFPLEVEIGNILRKKGWVVVNQWPYRDKVTKKIRLADILAIKIYDKPSGFLPMVLIECKMGAQHGWVFYTQEKEKELFPALGTIVDFVKKLSKLPLSAKLKELKADTIISQITGLPTPGMNALSRFSNLHILDRTIKIGVFSIVPSKKNDFLRATKQVISAMESIGEGQGASIIFPTIVFDGDMYEFYKENDETIILPTNHIQYIAVREDAHPFLIDVIKKAYFLEFLKIIERDFNILTDFLNFERRD